jgi:carbon-monoxide dehydrogenase small subunit
MWDSHSFQCGFCTPGIVMQAAAFLGDHPDADEQQIREALSGNICRCTGYQSIIDGVLLAAERSASPDPAAPPSASPDPAAPPSASPDPAAPPNRER